MHGIIGRVHHGRRRARLTLPHGTKLLAGATTLKSNVETQTNNAMTALTYCSYLNYVRTPSYSMYTTMELALGVSILLYDWTRNLSLKALLHGGYGVVGRPASCL